MRRALDLVYGICGGLAACFIVAIVAVVLAQVVLNLASRLSRLVVDEPIGLVIPSYAEFAGFFLAAATFLAIAYTLRSGEHIRVTLLVQRLQGMRRRWVEVWCLAVAGGLSGFFAYYALALTVESYQFGDLSPGIVPIPLWIPQSAMTLGLFAVTVAFVDRLVQEAFPRVPAAAQADAADRSAGETLP